jgi:hypothetical protein
MLYTIMKTQLLISFFVFFTFQASAQAGQTKILEDAVRSLKEPSKIIYVDSSMNFYGFVSDASKKGKLYGYFDTSKVSLKLERNEIRYLDKEFKKDSTFAWAANMFNNSVITSYDSADQYRRKYLNEQKEKKNKRFFLFSRIVYFRNNSIAVFRLAEMYEYSAGYDYLFFYRKIDGDWKRYMKVYMGAW